MSRFLSGFFQPLHCDAPAPQPPASDAEEDDVERYQHAHQVVVPHLPGEGRFTLTAKVRVPRDAMCARGTAAAGLRCAAESDKLRGALASCDEH